MTNQIKSLAIALSFAFSNAALAQNSVSSDNSSLVVPNNIRMNISGHSDNTGFSGAESFPNMEACWSALNRAFETYTNEKYIIDQATCSPTDSNSSEKPRVMSSAELNIVKLVITSPNGSKELMVFNCVRPSSETSSTGSESSAALECSKR